MQNSLLSTSPDALLKAKSSTELLAIIARQEAELLQQQAELKEAKNHSEEKDRYIKILEEYLRLATVQRFGASSEKLPFQSDLFDEAELEEALTDLADQVDDEDLVDPKPRNKSRNRGFSGSLLRKRIELLLSDEERDGASRTFFVKTKEELEYIPAQLNVLEYWQEKAVFNTVDAQGEAKEQIIAAARPVHPLGKCFASTSLLAYIIVAKYADGLPLYRMEGILKRYGHEVSRSNMANWIIRLSLLFQPLINLLREIQNSGGYLNGDETRIQVLKEDGKTAQSDKWMWVTCGGPPDQESVLFEYDPSRAGAVPSRLLEDFSGILQVDGYAGYARICRENGIERIGCWDHARRKFVEAVKAAETPKGKKLKPTLADIALSKIRKLYRIEKEIKKRSDEERYQIRQELSVPILDELKAWMDKNLTGVPKGSHIHKAMSYTLNQWETLTGYCDHGYLEISNARAENAIRPFAVGRRAWLFSDTSQGARASAICYSLIETAKLNRIEPSAYIEYILNQIGTADTLEKIEALLPWNVPLEKSSQTDTPEGK